MATGIKLGMLVEQMPGVAERDAEGRARECSVWP
jgi:hypothetical protein